MRAKRVARSVPYALAWGYLTFTKGGRTIYAIGSFSTFWFLERAQIAFATAS